MKADLELGGEPRFRCPDNQGPFEGPMKFMTLPHNNSATHVHTSWCLFAWAKFIFGSAWMARFTEHRCMNDMACYDAVICSCILQLAQYLSCLQKCWKSHEVFVHHITTVAIQTLVLGLPKNMGPSAQVLRRVLLLPILPLSVTLLW